MKIFVKILFYILFSVYSNAITINLIALSYYERSNLYPTVINEFNKYSKLNNLDIKLQFVLFSEKNTSIGRDQYDSTIDLYLKKKTKKFDLYIFDPIYTKRYSSHFIDLNKWLPKEHLDLYSSGEAKKICVYNNKWVGLPFFLKYTVLYSNISYLKKYHKNIPLTWDELIDTGKYILKKEHELNNTNIIGYNGLFSNNENTMCSIYQLIYSYRETKESPFPGIESKEAIDALDKLTEIKNSLSS
eukprot:jgi/Orpsp1_1/1191654/evm.model.d7180000087585.1